MNSLISYFLVLCSVSFRKSRKFKCFILFSYHHRSLDVFADTDALCTFCTKQDLQTLFRPRNELEVVALLRRIIHENLVVVGNVVKTSEERFHLWQGKNLRSRQRNNYVRLLNRWVMLDSKMLYSISLLHNSYVTASFAKRSAIIIQFTIEWTWVERVLRT